MTINKDSRTQQNVWCQISERPVSSSHTVNDLKYHQQYQDCTSRLVDRVKNQEMFTSVNFYIISLSIKGSSHVTDI